KSGAPSRRRSRARRREALAARPGAGRPVGRWRRWRAIARAEARPRGAATARARPPASPEQERNGAPPASWHPILGAIGGRQHPLQIGRNRLDRLRDLRLFRELATVCPLAPELPHLAGALLGLV